MDAHTWDKINQLREWLDAEIVYESETERCLQRVLKIGEEFGEACEAVFGALGANPRKGPSHSWADVRKELADVAVTALVALASVGSGADKEFDDRLQHLVDRVAAPPAGSGTPPA